FDELERAERSDGHRRHNVSDKQSRLQRSTVLSRRPGELKTGTREYSLAKQVRSVKSKAVHEPRFDPGAVMLYVFRQTLFPALVAIFAAFPFSPTQGQTPEPLGPSTRRTGLVISEIMYHPLPRADGRNLEFIEL